MTVCFAPLKSDYLPSFVRGMFEGVQPMKADQTQTLALNKAAEKGQLEGTLFSLWASVLFFCLSQHFLPHDTIKRQFL